MEFKEVILTETDKLLEKYKEKLLSINHYMTTKEEICFKAGIAAGITIAGNSTAKIDAYELLFNNNMNTPIETLMQVDLNTIAINYKQKLKSDGIEMQPIEELCFKAGISNGITLTGLALVNINTHNLIL